MRSSSQTVAQYISNFLSNKGCSDVFMVTGGGAMFLNDSFSRNKKLKAHCFHHEQACSMAAESYFRVTNRPAIVNVTTGPGATNAITGVYGAFVDSCSMIVVSGQVKRPTLKRYHSHELRQLGDQEVDIIPMVKSITKYSVLLDDPTMVEYELEKAFHLSTTGRPGPVWIDVPIDVQSSVLPPQRKKFIPLKPKVSNISSKVNKLVKKICESKRPVIIVGTGIHLSQTAKEVISLAKKFSIPIVTSFCASDVLPSNHPNFIGRQGTIGDRAGNFATQSADLVLILGARMNIRQISYNWENFAKNAYKVMVDIDPEELNKPTLKIDLKINTDLKHFFLEVNKVRITPKLNNSYLRWCQNRKANYPAAGLDKYKSKKLNPYSFVNEFSKIVPENSIIVTADAAAAITTFQTFQIKKGQRLFSNSGSAPMGFDLPAVIGAAIAKNHMSKSKNTKVICFAGDGSIMMNLQELQTIITNKLNVLIVIINNGGYLSIVQTQRNYFKDNIFGCLPSTELDFPDFKKTSKAFGINYISVRSLKNLGKVKVAINQSGPIICEAFVDPSQNFEPKLVSRQLADGTFVSPQLDDMYPFLSEDELKRNRIP